MGQQVMEDGAIFTMFRLPEGWEETKNNEYNKTKRKQPKIKSISNRSGRKEHTLMNAISKLSVGNQRKQL